MKRVLTLFTLLGMACSSGTKHSEPDLVQETADQQEEETSPQPGGPTEVNKDFLIAYLYMGRYGLDKAGRTELIITHAKDPKQQTIVTKGQDWSCQDGCILSKDFGFLGVYGSVEQPNTPPTLTVFKLGKDFKSLEKIATVEKVEDAHFSSARLFFSTKGSCPQDTQTDSQFCIWSLNLQKGAKPKALFSFPPPDDALDYANGEGRFSVGADDVLVLLRPTIYSQKVYLWKEGILKQVGEEVCFQRDAVGRCTGTGSWYSDTDPVALSPDLKYVVFSALALNREVRLYKIKLGDNLKTLSMTYSTFYSTAGPYSQLACDLRKPWQYIKVLGPMRFDSEGEGVYFIGNANCWSNEGGKEWTNIIKVEAKDIGTGHPLGKAQLYHVTHFPANSGAKTVVVTDFAFSPDEQYIVFVGTPTVQTDGTPIPDASSRHTSDQEVYIVDSQGKYTPVQVTNSLQYAAVKVWTRSL